MTNIYYGNGLVVIDITKFTARQVGAVLEAEAKNGYHLLTATDRFLFLVDK